MLRMYRRIGLKSVVPNKSRDSIPRRSSNSFRNGNKGKNHWGSNVTGHMPSSSGKPILGMEGNGREISEKYELFRDVVQNLGVLDCLLSLAAVASLPGYAKPEFVDKGGIEVINARHPMVEQILVDSFVPNDINLKVSSFVKCG